MKRQKISIPREVEAQQNEVNERKRARLSDLSSDGSFSPTECIGIKNGDFTNNANSEAATDGNSSQYTDVKTSTPITSNGLTGDISYFYHQTSSNVESIPCSSLKVPNVFNYTTLPVDVNSKADSKDGLQGNTPNDAVLASIGSANGSDGLQEIDVLSTEFNHTEDAAFIKSSGEDLLSKDSGEKSSVTTKCDVEYFLSSLLEPYELGGHAENVTSVVADGDIILSASSDTTIKLWNPYEKKEACNFQGHSGSVNSLLLLSAEQTVSLSERHCFQGTTRIVISGSSDCSIRLWSVDEGIELLSLYTYNGITCLGYFEEMKCVAVGTDGGKLELWDLSSCKALHSVIAHDDSITDLKVDDCFIYTTSSDGKVKVWLFDDGELQAVYCRSRKETIDEKESRLKPCNWRCVAAHDGLMYLGDNTSNLKVLDWKAGRLRMLRNQIQSKGFIDAVCVKQNILLSSSYDYSTSVGAINVWQLPSMTYICTMSGDLGSVSSLDVTETPNGILRVASGGSKLVIWDFVCSKKPSAQSQDKYFCREIDNLGEEVGEKSCESTRSLHADVSQLGSPKQSWNCVLL